MDPDPGGPKEVDPDPDSDPKHWMTVGSKITVSKTVVTKILQILLVLMDPDPDPGGPKTHYTLDCCHLYLLLSFLFIAGVDHLLPVAVILLLLLKKHLAFVVGCLFALFLWQFFFIIFVHFTVLHIEICKNLCQKRVFYRNFLTFSR